VSDAGRVTFMKAVTDQLTEQARAEGFAQVVTKAGPIGVLFDCGAPGDYLALASCDAATGGTHRWCRRPAPASGSQRRHRGSGLVLSPWPRSGFQR
jgi:hypothetical protein